MEDNDAPHPPAGAWVYVWWEDGRMRLRETPPTVCTAAHDHLDEVVVHATLVDQQEAPFIVPDEALVWAVHAQAPTPGHVGETARSVAKALGFPMNPALEGQ